MGPAAAVKYAAFAVMAVASLRMWVAITTVSTIYFRTEPPVGPRALRRTTRRMMHTVALWEVSVALVAATLGGWSSAPNVIALTGTAAMLWWSPLLIDQQRRLR